jgi:TadE-like protein
MPILALLVFGIIEFGFLLRDYAGVSSLVRTGARIASTGADHGPGVCDTSSGAPVCTPASSPALAQEAADAIQRSGIASNPDQIQYILVYKANDKGFPGADGSTAMPADCSGIANCVKFVWRPTVDKFKFNSGSWNSTTISACFPGNSTNPMDRVGIYLKANHQMLTGLFGSSITLSDRAVMDFEPLATQSCGSGQHQ